MCFKDEEVINHANAPRGQEKVGLKSTEFSNMNITRDLTKAFFFVEFWEETVEIGVDSRENGRDIENSEIDNSYTLCSLIPLGYLGPTQTYFLVLSFSSSIFHFLSFLPFPPPTPLNLTFFQEKVIQ